MSKQQYSDINLFLFQITDTKFLNQQYLDILIDVLKVYFKNQGEIKCFNQTIILKTVKHQTTSILSEEIHKLLKEENLHKIHWLLLKFDYHDNIKGWGLTSTWDFMKENEMLNIFNTEK